MGCFGSTDVQPVLGRYSQRTSKTMTNKPAAMLVEKSLFVNKSYKDQIAESILQKISQKSNSYITDASLVFKASEHKFKSKAFREVCHEVSNTILIACTSQNNYFGGYTPCMWKKDKMLTYEQDASSVSFLFKVGERTVRYYHLQPHQSKFAILNDSESGPVFGQGHDINIVDRSDKGQSWNNLGKSYECEFPYGSTKSLRQLCGCERYKLKDYEIWKIQFK